MTRGCTARILEKFCRRLLNWLYAMWTQGKDGTVSSLLGDVAFHSSMQDKNAMCRHWKFRSKSKYNIKKRTSIIHFVLEIWQNSLKEENHFKDMSIVIGAPVEVPF